MSCMSLGISVPKYLIERDCQWNGNCFWIRDAVEGLREIFRASVLVIFNLKLLCAPKQSSLE